MSKTTLLASSIALAAAVAFGETTRDYVQDGLLACWDGVENAGRHCHATAPSVWKDVVGGREFTLTGVTVGADRMVFAGSASSYGTLNAADTAATFEKTKNGTLEIVYAAARASFSGSVVILQSTTSSGVGFGILKAGTSIIAGNNSAPTFTLTSGIATNSVSVKYSNAIPQSMSANGSTPGTGTNNNWGNPDGTTTTTIGNRNSLAAGFPGAIYCVRLYSRQLTDEEVAANRAVDLSRFRQGNVPGDEDLVISATPVDAGSPTPAYGEEGGLAAGATMAVSCPEVWTNVAENVAVDCNGWKLYDSAGNELSSGPETSFTYTHPDPAAYRRLEWQLSVKYKVAATANAGGSVSPSVQWVSFGQTATVTATPDSSHVFYKWTNDVPGTVAAASTTISFPVHSSSSLFAVYGNKRQLNDIATLQTLIDSSSPGDRIVLADGLHRPDYTIYLTNGVTLAGSSFTNCVIKPTGSRRVLYIGGAETCLSNITITGGVRAPTSNTDNAAGIYMKNGLITHCMISNNVINNAKSYHQGIGVYMAAGTLADSIVAGNSSSASWCTGGGVFMVSGEIRNCTIRNNSVSGGNSQGGGICAKGGVVTHTSILFNKSGGGGGGMIFGGYNTALESDLLVNRCLVAGNSCSGTSYGGGGIWAYAVKNGGAVGKWTMRNTTIACNTAKTQGGGICIQNVNGLAACQSCIIAENTETTVRDAAGYPEWYTASATNTVAGKLSHCLFGDGVAVRLGAGSIVGSAAFKSLANHDYHLSAISDAIDNGLVSAYVTDDLDGCAVTDGHPDIGCYEFNLASEPFSCALDYSASSIFEGATVSLAATPVNPPTGVTLRYVWMLSDGGENVITATGAETTATLSSVGFYSVTLRVYNDSTDDLLLETVGETTLPIYVRELYATPADNVAAIMDGLVEGQILHLAAGTYPIASSASIKFGAAVIGAGRDATIFDLGQHDYAINVNHIRASMTGVTVMGGKTKTHCLKVTGGTLTDARVTGCWIQNGNSVSTDSSHAPLWVSGGIADRVIIDHNTNTTSTARAPTWIYPNVSGVALNGGGTLRNSLVCHNYSDALSCDGTVMVGSHISGGGTVLNCTVADNVNAGNTSECVAILANKGSTIRNTIVARNSSPNWTSATRANNDQNYPCVSSAPNWAYRSDAGNNSASYNCWGESAETYGSHCANGAQISFINPVGGNWRIGVNSSCRDAGLNETWMSTAIDLAGNPRIFHDIVDLGCYENQSRPTTVLMLR